MTARSLLNLGILVAVIILAAVAFYPRQHAEPPNPTVNLLTLNKTAIQTISIQGHGRPELRFSKQDQQWFMTTPVRTRAAEHRVTGLLNILEQPADHKLPVSKADLPKYGLDTPRFTLRFNDLPVIIGGTDPIHKRRYVMAQDAVYLVDDTFSRWLGEGAGAFIDSALLPPDSIIKKIQLPDFTVTKADGKWQYSLVNNAGAESSPHFSQDALQTFIDEWRYGRALQVSLLAEPFKQPANGRQFKVFLQKGDETVVFYEQTSAEEIALVRADLNLRYQLTKDTVQRLTTVTQPEDIEPDPEAEPSEESEPAAT